MNTRPTEVGEWMKAVRPLKDMVVKDLAGLKLKWRGWWSSLQASGPADSPWESLRKPGKNGLVLVLICLVWWGNAANADSEWKRAVGDVVEALQGLQGTKKTDPAEKGRAPQQSLIGGRKRKRKDDDEGQGNNTTPPLRKLK